jgi:microcystin-dependent protein
MSQFDFGTIDPNIVTGTQLAQFLNDWRDALHSDHIGALRPTYAVQGMSWIDNSAAPTLILKTYDGTNDIERGRLNLTDGIAYLIVPSLTGLPTAPQAYQLHVDDTASPSVLVRIRDDANANWLTIGEINAGVWTPYSAGSPVGGGGGGLLGEVRWYSTSTAPPAGWLFADGSAISRVTYADLFALIGTTWGIGDGATTFNIPDLRGKSPVGSGEDTGLGLTNRIVGQEGGEEGHALTTGEMPSHNHPGSGFSGGSVSIPTGAGTGPSIGTLARGGSFIGNTVVGVSGTATVTAQGGGGAHNTMHPYAVLQPIIRATN